MYSLYLNRMLSYREYIEQAIYEPEDCLTSTIRDKNYIYGRTIWKAMNHQSNMYKILLRPFNIADYYYNSDEWIEAKINELRKVPEKLVDMAFGC